MKNNISDKVYNTQFKTQIALEALKGEKSIEDLVNEYHVTSRQIKTWKRRLLDDAENMLLTKDKKSVKKEAPSKDKSKELIQLQIELEWLKSKLMHAPAVPKINLIDPTHPTISVRRQCELLEVNRSMLYYQKSTAPLEDFNIMRLIDQVYTLNPNFGSRRITAELNRQHDKQWNRKRIQRLMRLMGFSEQTGDLGTIQESAPEPRFEFLLTDFKTNSANHVWSANITYVPMTQGSAFMVAIVDWHSQYVLAWKLSEHKDEALAYAALIRALNVDAPKIFHIDQTLAFSHEIFVQKLKEANIEISVDRRSRFLDVKFVENIWRPVKQDHLYTQSSDDITELEAGLTKYFKYYNYQRRQENLGDKTPAEIYFGSIDIN